MGFSTKTSDSIDGGNFLTEPGTYHFILTEVKDSPTKKNGELIKGAALQAQMQVLAGTTPGQEQKQFTLILFEPDMSAKDEGHWNRQKITAFLLATDLISPSELGKDVDVDLQKAESRQVIATLEVNTYNGKTNLQLAYSNIWHVDHPDAAKFPKDEKSLSLLPSSARHKPGYWGDSASSQSKSEPKPKPQAEKSLEGSLADL